jgi:hypothetical protein
VLLEASTLSSTVSSFSSSTIPQAKMKKPIFIGKKPKKPKKPKALFGNENSFRPVLPKNEIRIYTKNQPQFLQRENKVILGKSRPQKKNWELFGVTKLFFIYS